MKIPHDRQRSIESHVRNDDYFATLASVLDLLGQEMAESSGQREQTALLRRLRDDLLHLQDNYEIKPRGGKHL
jgi:hypothetical protein